MIWYEVIGWVSTLLVLIGYWLNANAKYRLAMMVWIVGDVGWITYDIIRGIFPHLALSSVIIILNLYGIYKIIKNNRKYAKSTIERGFKSSDGFAL
jgi:hypothetical protein